MKITLASCQNKYCGLGQYTEQLTQAFQRAGYASEAYRKDDEAPPLFRSYPYRSFRQLRPYVAPYYLSRALRAEKADIWQTDYVDAAMAAILAGKTNPLFVTIHDAIPFVYSSSRWGFKVYRYQLNQTLQKARAIVVVSEHARQEVLNYTSVLPERVFAVHNGVDHRRYRLPAEDPQNEVFTIKYLGGLGVPHKNAIALLQTAQILQDKQVPFRLEIGGHLPEQHPLRCYAQEHGLDTVHFAGFVPEEEMAAFYQSADLFFFPSLLEGFGLPPLEAMACGTPAVVSDIPVLREVLGEAGIYASPTPEGYAQEIVKAIQQPDFLAEKRQQAIVQASQYSWERTAQQMIDLYTRYA